MVDAGPSAGTIRSLRAALSTASSLTVDSNWPGASQQFGLCGQRRDGAGPAGRRVHPTADRQCVADGLAGVDVQAGGRRGVGAAHAEQQFGACHRVDVGGHRDGQPERLGEHRPDRGVRPAEPGVVEVSGGGVDDAAGGDADPQRLAAVPAAQVAARAVGQRRQRGVLRALRGRRLHHVERAAEQVGGHDAGGTRADVDAKGQERLVVDLDGDAWPADGAGHREIGPLTQHARVEQRGDLAVHRGNGQPGDSTRWCRGRSARAGGRRRRRIRPRLRRRAATAPRRDGERVAAAWPGGIQCEVRTRPARLPRSPVEVWRRVVGVLTGCPCRVVGGDPGHAWRLLRTEMSAISQARRIARQQHERRMAIRAA